MKKLLKQILVIVETKVDEGIYLDKKILVMIFLILIMILSSVTVIKLATNTGSINQISHKTPLRSIVFNTGAININGNAQFAVYASSGDGSSNSPYIIQNYLITNLFENGYAVEIQDTNKYFILENIKVSNAIANGILLFNVTHGRIINSFVTNSINSGFILEFSSNNILKNNTINNNGYNGFRLDKYSYNNSLINNTANNIKNDGYYLNLATNNTLTNNLAINNTANGFELKSSFNNILSTNIGQNNTKYDYYASSSSNNSLNNNIFPHLITMPIASSSTSTSSPSIASSSTSTIANGYLGLIPIIVFGVIVCCSVVVFLFRKNLKAINTDKILKNKLDLSDQTVKPSSSAFCPICGLSILPEDQYCMNCGTKLKV